MEEFWKTPQSVVDNWGYLVPLGLANMAEMYIQDMIPVGESLLTNRFWLSFEQAVFQMVRMDMWTEPEKPAGGKP